jgi:hypothetical protein
MKLEKQISTAGKAVFLEHLTAQYPGVEVKVCGKYFVIKDSVYWVMTKRMVQYVPIKDVKHWVTGVNLDKLKAFVDFIEQQNLTNGYVVFVDVSTKTVYGGLLEKLETPTKVESVYYPVEHGSAAAGKLRYWHQSQMSHICKISEEQLSRVMKLVILNKTPKGQTT